MCLHRLQIQTPDSYTGVLHSVLLYFNILANETAWCGRPPVTRDIDGIVTHIGRQIFAPGVMVALQVSIERYAREAMRVRIHHPLPSLLTQGIVLGTNRSHKPERGRFDSCPLQPVMSAWPSA